jgi:hypothetical protein
MRTSYAVVWRERGRAPATGKLELLPRAVRLEGMAESRPTLREIAYDSLKSVRVGRSTEDRIDGRPSLVLERRSGEPVAITSVAQPGIVAELAERLAELQLGSEAARRTAVVVPLVPGAHEAARALLEQGPPFDLEQSGLERHEVFLTPDEVVFVFESRVGAEAWEPLLADPKLWERAAAWRDHIAGPPRIAESAYFWARADGPPRSNGASEGWLDDF